MGFSRAITRTFELVRALLLRVVTTCPGVLSVQRFSVNYDQSARQLTFAFQATCTDGPIVVTPGSSDFLLDVAA